MTMSATLPPPDTPLALQDGENVGGAMHALIADLYPICRSITGEGFRETLRRLQAYLPHLLSVNEVPTGTKVLDWTVPNEWNIRDAYVKNSRGERVIDFQRSSLHVLNYSVPVNRRMSSQELREHCFSLPDHPGWIPYRTSYYKEAWGFCVTHRQLQALTEDEYEVHIDSTLAPGHLTYGEVMLRGETPDEVLISCHACHPSLCNDNLSGIAVATYLVRALREKRRRHTYRVLFIPGTIGSITWLARNEGVVPRIKHGLVVAGLGDSGSLHYKRSRRGNAEIDRAATHVLRQSGHPFGLIDFAPYGYDERQYCSPGYDLPVGCLSRTPYGRYPQYHTSADNLDFVLPGALTDSLNHLIAICDLLDGNGTYVNRSPKGEPQLGRRGLYGAIGGKSEARIDELAMLWVLNLSDGRHSLLDIAERSALPFSQVRHAADALAAHGLLTPKGVL
jgi:aminopeptidase-like protein